MKITNNSSAINADEVVHLLNGDALATRFPKAITGAQIIMRECLVDGDVSGETFEQFITTRANFIGQYPDCSSADYYQSSLPELEKIKNLDANTPLVCWFEQDLFCQVNFWYVCYLLTGNNRWQGIYLVLPNQGNEYSFAHMTDTQLLAAFANKHLLTERQLKFMANLWRAYQQQNWQQLAQLAQHIPSELLFVEPALKAQLARQPDQQGLGLPERVLLTIMRQQTPLSFASVFQQFYQQMAVYSFGDLQVKAMYEKLLERL